MEYCDSTLLKVAMLQIDLAKAFDMVPHNILFMLIEYVGLGSVMCKGIRMAYKSSTTNLIVNGELSQRIQVLSSVRQGCPLSPLLFALFLEPLCRKVISSAGIKGFRLQACEVRVLAYADDIAFFAVDGESVNSLLRITERFCDTSGSLMNKDKSVGLWHGNWDHTPNSFGNIRWLTTPSRYLGVPLDRYKDSDSLWLSKA